MMISKNYYIIILFFWGIILGIYKASAQTDNKIQNLPKLELKLQNNKTVKLNELNGKVVLFDFWYRGCVGCIQTIPGLIKLQEEFKDDLVIIGINSYDIQEDVIDYIDYKKMNYSSTYKTENNISKIFDVKAYPTIILYDREGHLLKIETGYHKNGMNSVRKAIKKALK